MPGRSYHHNVISTAVFNSGLIWFAKISNAILILGHQMTAYLFPLHIKPSRDQVCPLHNFAVEGQRSICSVIHYSGLESQWQVEMKSFNPDSECKTLIYYILYKQVVVFVLGWVDVKGPVYIYLIYKNLLIIQHTCIRYIWYMLVWSSSGMLTSQF